MNRNLFLTLFVLFILIACKPELYKPEGLRKLSNDEIIERVKNKVKPNPNIVIKDQQGNILLRDAIMKMENLESYTTDVYVNDEGLDVEIIHRKATEEDLKVIEEIEKILDERRPVQRVETVDIDCSSLENLLNGVLEADQGIRNGDVFDPEVDKANLSKVVSILQRCNLKEVKNLPQKSLNTIWLVIQHGPSFYQNKYLPLFRKWADDGNIEQSSIALMQDRILMQDGKLQIYGSQVIKNEEGEWEVYKLRDPAYVDQRRASVGLGPLKDYVKRWDINFDFPQEQK